MNEKNHTTIGSAPLGIEPNMTCIHHKRIVEINMISIELLKFYNLGLIPCHPRRANVKENSPLDIGGLVWYCCTGVYTKACVAACAPEKRAVALPLLSEDSPGSDPLV